MSAPCRRCRLYRWAFLLTLAALAVTWWAG